MNRLQKTEAALGLIDRILEIGFRIADRVRARRATRAKKKA